MDLGRTVEAERLKDAMETSRASIAETVDELRGAVSQAMDWREYVKTHPGATLGIAATAGVVAGHWLGGKLLSEDSAAPRPAAAQVASATPPRLLDGSKSRAGARMESLVNLVIDEVADAVETAAIVPLFARLRTFLRSSAGPAAPGELGSGVREAGSAATSAVDDPHRGEGDVPAWATSAPATGRWER
jgi:hypothetical protein